MTYAFLYFHAYLMNHGRTRPCFCSHSDLFAMEGEAEEEAEEEEEEEEEA